MEHTTEDWPPAPRREAAIGEHQHQQDELNRREDHEEPGKRSDLADRRQRSRRRGEAVERVLLGRQAARQQHARDAEQPADRVARQPACDQPADSAETQHSHGPDAVEEDLAGIHVGRVHGEQDQACHHQDDGRSDEHADPGGILISQEPCAHKADCGRKQARSAREQPIPCMHVLASPMNPPRPTGLLS
jgi:hypothetical protein